MSMKNTLVLAVSIVAGCVLIMWWLEDFNRQRMVADWKQFVDDWQRKAGAPDAG